MRSVVPAIALAAFALLATEAKAQFQSIGSVTSPHIMDAANDYDLYIALPGTDTGWYILWTYPDGTTQLSYAFATEAKAKNHHDYLMWFGFDPRGGYMQPGNVPIAEFIEGPRDPDWQYYGRYDTLSAAEDVADWLRDFGLLSDIRGVSVLRTRLW